MLVRQKMANFMVMKILLRKEINLFLQIFHKQCVFFKQVFFKQVLKMLGKKNLFFLSAAGDLIPRHQQVFSTNQFFCGVSIPEPQEMVTPPAQNPSAPHHNSLSTV